MPTDEATLTHRRNEPVASVLLLACAAFHRTPIVCCFLCVCVLVFVSNFSSCSLNLWLCPRLIQLPLFSITGYQFHVHECANDSLCMGCEVALSTCLSRPPRIGVESTPRTSARNDSIGGRGDTVIGASAIIRIPKSTPRARPQSKKTDTHAQIARSTFNPNK